MLYQRIQQQQKAALLAQQIAAMPEYPIYREAPDRYSIYVDGQRHVFATEASARMAQLAARARWLYNHCDA
jgi:hypothetical protein